MDMGGIPCRGREADFEPRTVRHGLSQALGSPSPSRASRRRQRSFSGSLSERLAQIGREKGVEPDAIEIWFADEARIGQKNKITRRWAKRGTRPSAPKDQRTASAYIFGAICPRDGKGAALVMPRCDTEAMNLHLAEIATQIAPGAHAALLVDQAGWHLSGSLKVPPNITLIPLPAKCPELNPQENVWQENVWQTVCSLPTWRSLAQTSRGG
jgi:hypothetical protein